MPHFRNRGPSESRAVIPPDSGYHRIPPDPESYIRIYAAHTGAWFFPLSPAGCPSPEPWFILVDSDRSSAGDSGPQSIFPPVGCGSVGFVWYLDVLQQYWLVGHHRKFTSYVLYSLCRATFLTSFDGYTVGEGVTNLPLKFHWTVLHGPPECSSRDVRFDGRTFPPLSRTPLMLYFLFQTGMIKVLMLCRYTHTEYRDCLLKWLHFKRAWTSLFWSWIYKSEFYIDILS